MKQSTNDNIMLTLICMVIGLSLVVICYADSKPNKAAHVARLAPVLMKPINRSLWLGAKIVHNRQKVTFEDIELTEHHVAIMVNDESALCFFSIPGQPYHKIGVRFKFGKIKPVQNDDIFKKGE